MPSHNGHSIQGRKRRAGGGGGGERVGQLLSKGVENIASKTQKNRNFSFKNCHWTPGPGCTTTLPSGYTDKIGAFLIYRQILSAGKGQVFIR